MTGTLAGGDTLPGLRVPDAGFVVSVRAGEGTRLLGRVVLG